MTWEPRPLPDVTPETEPYWKAAADGRLLLSRCDACGFVYHYPRALCPDCLSDDISWLESDGVGSVYSFAVSERVSGWPDEDLPLINAIVELAEGPRLESLVVDVAPDDVAVGSRVSVRFRETDRDDVAIPVFTLAPESA